MAGAAFPDEVAALRSRLRAYALRLTRNPDDADDLVQDVMLKAIIKQDLFATSTNLFGWLAMIMLNHFRTQSVRHWRIVPLADGLEEAMPANDDQAASFEAKQSIAMLLRLPDIHQRAILQAVDGTSYEEMAAAEGVPVGTIRSRINRARSNFAALVNGGAPC
jgi:RNA polymerase sigma-70 factor, ECF subfamily